MAAGPLNTPKILMLSGIGDCSYLNSLGIECEINNTHVGKHLKDHVAYYNYLLPAQLFPSNDGPIVEAHIRSPWAADLAADIQVAFTTEAILAPTLPSFLLALIVDTNTASEGQIQLKSTNALDDASVLWNLTPDPTSSDAAKVVWALNTSLNAYASTGWYGPRFTVDGTIPQLDVNSIGLYAQPYYHYTKSCALGLALDDTGLLIGSKNIYVIDGSAIPGTCSTHPSRETYALAANIIKGLEPSINLCN